MSVEQFEHIKPLFASDLARVAEKWGNMDKKEKCLEIIRLFDLAIKNGFRKECFLEEVDNFFDINARTSIRLWIDTSLMHGRRFLFEALGQPDEAAVSPISIPDRAEPKSDMRVPSCQKTTALTADEEVCGGYKKNGKRHKQIQKPLTLKSLITSKKCNHFSEKDAEFAYQNIAGEWGNLSYSDRASVIKELFRFESSVCDDEKKVIAKICKKIDFLSKNMIIGYMEISGRSDSLKRLVVANHLDEQCISVIGDTRMELGELFDPKILSDEIFKAVQKPINLTEEKQLKADSLKKICAKIRKAAIAIKNLKVGEIYTINPKSPAASKEYEGYIGDTFQFADQNDERLSQYQSLKKSPFHVLFIGRGKRVFIIDYRVVCRLSDVELISDF